MDKKKDKTHSKSKSQGSHRHTSLHHRSVNKLSRSPRHSSISSSRSRSAHRSRSLSSQRSRSRPSRSRSRSRSPKTKPTKSRSIEKESTFYPGLYSLPQPPIPGSGIPGYPGIPLSMSGQQPPGQNDLSTMVPPGRGFFTPVPGVLPGGLPGCNMIPAGSRGFDGFIFECNNLTIDECMKLQLFGGPKYMLSQVTSITPYNTPLFLYHNTNRTLYGVFESTSAGRENINPSAWHRSGGPTPFPSQVSFRYKYQFHPLHESEFQHVLNYTASNKPRPELHKDQISQLIKLFAINNAKIAHRAAKQLIQFFKLE